MLLPDSATGEPKSCSSAAVGWTTSTCTSGAAAVAVPSWEAAALLEKNARGASTVGNDQATRVPTGTRPTRRSSANEAAIRSPP